MNRGQIGMFSALMAASFAGLNREIEEEKQRAAERVRRALAVGLPADAPLEAIELLERSNKRPSPGALTKALLEEAERAVLEATRRPLETHAFGRVLTAPPAQPRPPRGRSLTEKKARRAKRKQRRRR